MKSAFISIALIIFYMTHSVWSDNSPIQPAASTFFLDATQIAVAEKASAKGSAQDAFRLAHHYLIAMNDGENGEKWLLKAAELGLTEAQYELGAILLDLPSKREEGIAWIHRSALGGNKKAKKLIELLKNRGSP